MPLEVPDISKISVFLFFWAGLARGPADTHEFILLPGINQEVVCKPKEVGFWFLH